MDFSRAQQSATELFGGLKDRLGLQGSDARPARGERQPAQDYADYDMDYVDGASGDTGDYGPYSYDVYDDDLGYEPQPAVSSRPASSRSHRSSVSSPRLVTSDDVRATTSAFGVETRAMHPVAPVQDAEPQREEPVLTGREFVPERNEFVSPYAQGQSAAASGAATPVPAAARGVALIRPTSYHDVQGMAVSLRTGAIVVLDLRLADKSLAKRLMDFSFGVASALDAQVEGVSEDALAIFTGAALTDDERGRILQQVR